MESLKGAEIRPFPSSEEWERWLEEHHAERTEGIWFKFSKKGSGIPSPTYQDVLDAALRFGWIDGQRKGYDETWFLQKFTPRRPRSIWSKINKERAEKLIEEGRMEAAGFAAIEHARSNGRWDAAYAGRGSIEVHPELRAALEASPTATAFFETLRGSNRYAVLFRVQSAVNPETRRRRIAKLVGMLERCETIYP